VPRSSSATSSVSAPRKSPRPSRAARSRVKAALKRARATIEEHTGHPERPTPGSSEERELVRRFADAFERDDITGVVTLLTEDAWLTMPPSPLEYQGRDAIRAFLEQVHAWRGHAPRQLVATRANRQPAFAVYRNDDTAPVAHATGLVVLTLRGAQISTFTQFLDNGLLAHFGLPRTLPAR
jgi:hypothetical protein